MADDVREGRRAHGATVQALQRGLLREHLPAWAVQPGVHVTLEPTYHGLQVRLTAYFPAGAVHTAYACPATEADIERHEAALLRGLAHLERLVRAEGWLDG